MMKGSRELLPYKCRMECKPQQMFKFPKVGSALADSHTCHEVLPKDRIFRKNYLYQKKTEFL